MYINFRVLEKEEFSPLHLLCLVAIKQKDFNYLEGVCEDYIGDLLNKKYVKRVKVSKKLEGSLEALRITPEGNKLLVDLETAEVEEEDEVVFEWLKKHYKSLGKEIGNGAKTLRHIRDFRIKSGIEKNNLLILCLTFLRDEENMAYNNILEYAFYKAPTAFETRFNLEESRLYKYYLKREDYFKTTFKKT
jgi:SepF-like predicted cell division protein (DUF552 family)